MEKIFLILILLSINLFSQEMEKRFGIVTFRSSQHIYIKIQSTNDINQYDTLYNLFQIPIAIVHYKSSNSLAAKPLKEISMGDTVYALVINKTIPKLEIVNKIEITEQKKEDISTIKESPIKKSYNLRMSLQSYGDLNNLESTSRYRYSLNFNKEDFLINNLSFKSYIIFNYNKKILSSSFNKTKELLKIYDLSLEYIISSNHLIKIGRSLNPYIFTLGSIDGIQYTYSFRVDKLGVFLGSRPDYQNYWFSSKLLQTGIFYLRIDSLDKKVMENSIAFTEQTSNFKPDRRFLYLQHRNDFFPLTNIFLSSEIDFYNVSKGVITRNLNLTSFYSLISFRPFRQLNFNLSYDARKNIYYLESFKNSIDTLLENELKKGLRLSAFIRPFNFIFINLQYGIRETSKDKKSSNNIAGTIGFNYLPFIYSNLSFSFNKYKSPFVKGTNYSIYFSKNVFDNLNLTSSFKIFNFNMNSRLLIDRFIEFGVYMNIVKNLSFSINLEQKLNKEKSSYLMIDLTNRF